MMFAVGSYHRSRRRSREMDRVAVQRGFGTRRRFDAERREGRSHAERGNAKPANRHPFLNLRVIITLAATLPVSPTISCSPNLRAAERAPALERIDPDGIKGSLVICG